MTRKSIILFCMGQKTGEEGPPSTLKDEWEETFLIEKLQKFYHDYTGRSKDFAQFADFFDDFLSTQPSSCQNEIWTFLLDWIFKQAQLEPEIYVEMLIWIIDRFLSSQTFQRAAHDVLLQLLVDSIDPDQTGDGDTTRLLFCELVAKLAVKNWPSGFRSCIKQQNSVLYAALTTVHTWLDQIDTIINDTADSNGAVVELCCSNLMRLCSCTGRQFWLCWPELVDKVYTTFEKTITTNRLVVQEKTKRSMLNFYMKINDWSRSSSSKGGSSSTNRFKDVAAQTDRIISAEAPNTSRPRLNFDSMNKMSPVFSQSRHSLRQ